MSGLAVALLLPRHGLEAHGEQCTRWHLARMCVLQQHLRTMLARDFHDDGQAQAGAIGFRAKGAVERLEDQLALGQRHAGAAVFHLQQQT